MPAAEMTAQARLAKVVTAGATSTPAGDSPSRRRRICSAAKALGTISRHPGRARSSSRRRYSSIAAAVLPPPAGAVSTVTPGDVRAFCHRELMFSAPPISRLLWQRRR